MVAKNYGQMLITPKEVLKRAAPDRSLNDSQILDIHIRSAQEGHLRPALGDTLYEKMVSVDGSAEGAYKTLLQDYLLDALACFVMYEVEPHLSVKWSNSGLMNQQGHYSNTSSDAARDHSRNQYLKIANTILSRGLAYAEDNIEEYTSSEMVSTRASIRGHMVIRK